MDMDWNSILHNNFLIKLAAAAIELLVGFFLGPFIKRMVMRLHNKRGVDEGVLTFTGSFINIAIKCLAIIVALGQIGVDITVAAGLFSAVGLGVSLALKENMANVAGGLQILITKPFRVGSYIQVETMEGTVTSIEIMFTTLQTFDNQQIVIPNSYLISNPVTNYTEYPTRRIVLQIPVSSQAETAAFREKALALMEEHANVIKAPKPKTVIAGYTADGKGIMIKMVCYSRIEVYWETLYELQEQADALRKASEMMPPVDYIQVVK